jgi:subtilisin family serine protease
MNDPLLGQQWNLVNNGELFCKDGIVKSVKDADVQCAEAWERSTGDESVIVAVLDEGIFIDHPDLRDNIWENKAETYRSNKDNDNNGYVGDRYGYNFVHNSGIIISNDIYDSGHGTHVAGVIAAVNNNGRGVASIAGGNGSGGGVKIMVCQIFSGNVATSILSTVRAIKYAADNGAVVCSAVGATFRRAPTLAIGAKPASAHWRSGLRVRHSNARHWSTLPIVPVRPMALSRAVLPYLQVVTNRQQWRAIRVQPTSMSR